MDCHDTKYHQSWQCIAKVMVVNYKSHSNALREL